MARRRNQVSSNQTILIVDDQEEILWSVRALLEREGHRVLTAGSAEAALQVFRGQDVQVLLIDYFMPRMTGGDLVREIRRFDPFVQIILQTGYAGEKPARQMMNDLAIQGYHDKAEGPEKLLLWIDVAVKAHQLVSRVRDTEKLQRELVANVSHEFRTPLNIILGYSELLISGDFGSLPEEAIGALRRLTGATTDLSGLVMDLLSYAKVEAGAAEAEIGTIDTGSLAAELERLGSLLLERKPVRFSIDVAGAPREIETDETKLRVILRNLVTNAAKFTARGEVSVKVTATATGIAFSISDTGSGIAGCDLEKIFDPFRQIDGSATRRHGGIGLGLALSRKLAQILGGEIAVESELGRGSTFTVWLPFAPAAAVVDHAAQAPQTASWAAA